MGAVTIIKYVFGFAFGYIVYMLLGPVVYKTRYENSQWDDMPTNILAFGDQMYGIWILFIIVIAAVILLASIMEADRHRALQS